MRKSVLRGLLAAALLLSLTLGSTSYAGSNSQTISGQGIDDGATFEEILRLGDWEVVEDPLNDSDVQYFIREGLLVRDDLGTPEDEHGTPPPRGPGGIRPKVFPILAVPIVIKGTVILYAAGVAVGTAIVVYVVRTRQEAPEQPRPVSELTKIVGKVIKYGGPSTYVTCIGSYVYPPMTIEENRTCANVVATLTGNPDAGRAVSRHLGYTSELILDRTTWAFATATGRNMLVFQLGTRHGYYYSNRSLTAQPIEMDVAPMLVDNRTVIPVRYLGRTGLEITWTPPKPGVHKGMVGIRRPKDGLSAVFWIGEKRALMSTGEFVEFDLPPFIQNDRAFIGLRSALSKFCGVNWRPYHQSVVLSC